MSIRRSSTLALALGALLAGSVVVATPAVANSQATSPYGTFTCSDGRTFDIFGMPVLRFPSQVGFINDKAVVARWLDTLESGSVTVLDGVYVGQVIPFENSFSGPINRSRRASLTNLSELASCSTWEQYSYTFVMDEERAGYLGLDATYVGALVAATGSSTVTVWINAEQLAHR